MSKTYWFRYGHVEGISVSVGQHVKRGQQLAVIADQKDNGGWSPHLHFDCYQLPQLFTAYTKGMEYDAFCRMYLDPRKVITENGYMTPTGMPDTAMRWGFKHAQWAQYPTGSMFHPGWDYNWGAGADGEIGKPVYAVTDGVVEFVSSEKNKVGTWGGLVVIKVTKQEDTMNWEKIADDRLKQINQMEWVIKDKDAEIADLKRQLASQPTGDFVPAGQLYIKK